MEAEAKQQQAGGPQLPSKVQRWILAKKPKGAIGPHNFQLMEADPPQIDHGKVLVRPEYFSVDPYLRGWVVHEMSEGEVMVSGLVGRILDSRHDSFKSGQLVFCYGEWQTVVLADPSNRKSQVMALPEQGVKPSAYLGALGMPGATAYFGLKYAAPFKKGDICLVSSSAGAVGSMVSQLCKLWGAKRVIGSAQPQNKCEVAEKKFANDHCIDSGKVDAYEKMQEELKRLSPEGYDLFWVRQASTARERADTCIGLTTQELVQARLTGRSLCFSALVSISSFSLRTTLVVQSTGHSSTMRESSVRP